jgi:hypothetical protein
MDALVREGAGSRGRGGVIKRIHRHVLNHSYGRNNL